MKLIRKWQIERECRNCGSLLLIKEQDVKVWKHTQSDLMHTYATCMHCKHEIVLCVDMLPKTIYKNCLKKYEKLLNNFSYTQEFGYIPKYELVEKEKDKQKLKKDLEKDPKEVESTLI